MGSLLEEMIDLNRLTCLPDHNYHTIQFSSYDRNSVSPSKPGWFSNSDGFGNETRPGFEKVLQEPDSEGTGRYLICDIKCPGAIVRLWTAGINGKIKLFLDGSSNPVFDGEAKEFFWNTLKSISDMGTGNVNTKQFRQYDAVYFPIPFSRSCRIEWTGNLKEIHFYHVTVRVYEPAQDVATFKAGDLAAYSGQINEISKQFSKDDKPSTTFSQKINIPVPHASKRTVYTAEGTQAIEKFGLKIRCLKQEEVLRKCILSIYFDSASIPQVQAPAGDFFGAAPGLYPYNSLPFAVQPDSLMVCRFHMPFKENARIEIENFSDEDILVSGGADLSGYDWKEGESMYFQARWKISQGLTASDREITDIPYFMASGKGRIVGTAAYIYNPSPAVTSWGNWWGEGDEKIYIDGDVFPSFFGTGTEDYFNYSWSSESLFAFPYCGQPRNDGPGNRGYVSNYRWHILDDIPFYDHISFFMELFHHGEVMDFTYGRIVYFYSLPGLVDDYQKISEHAIAGIPYLNWEPRSYLGSSGFTFIAAENAFERHASLGSEKGKLWAGGSILMWKPQSEGERIICRFQRTTDSAKSNIGLTLAHLPDGGKMAAYLNGQSLKFDGSEVILLDILHNPVLRNHFSETVLFKKGMNELILENRGSWKGRIGLDFIWLKEE